MPVCITLHLTSEEICVHVLNQFVIFSGKKYYKTYKFLKLLKAVFAVLL